MDVDTVATDLSTSGIVTGIPQSTSPPVLELQPIENGDLSSTPQAASGGHRFQCPYCDKSYAKNSTLTLHINKHLGLVSVPSKVCKLCKKTFMDEEAYDAHMREHDLEMTKCSLCGMKFDTKEELEDHGRAHEALESIHLKNSGSKVHPFQCEICEKVLKNKKSYKQHVREHFGERKHKCELCGKTFKRTNHLKDHMYYHNRDPKFQCDVCGKICPTRSRLSMHKATHLDVKPHKCSQCDRTFATPRQMMEHEAVHSNARNYHCTICNVHYKHRRSLRNHNAAHHPKKPRQVVETIEKIIQPLGAAKDGAESMVIEPQFVVGGATGVNGAEFKLEPVYSIDDGEIMDLSVNGDRFKEEYRAVNKGGAIKETNNNNNEALSMVPHPLAQNDKFVMDTKTAQIDYATNAMICDITKKVSQNKDHSTISTERRAKNNNILGITAPSSLFHPRNTEDKTNNQAVPNVFPVSYVISNQPPKAIESDPSQTKAPAESNTIKGSSSSSSSSRRRKASNPRPVIQKTYRGLPCVYCDERFPDVAALNAHVAKHEWGTLAVQ